MPVLAPRSRQSKSSPEGMGPFSLVRIVASALLLSSEYPLQQTMRWLIDSTSPLPHILQVPDSAGSPSSRTTLLSTGRHPVLHINLSRRPTASVRSSRFLHLANLAAVSPLREARFSMVEAESWASTALYTMCFHFRLSIPRQVVGSSQKFERPLCSNNFCIDFIQPLLKARGAKSTCHLRRRTTKKIVRSWET